ncbi:hypothetical protein GCM10008985_16900 [Halococcus dombrowskii]|uniref:Uncharacterized protein n=1 Tax=Halococcus dombrowskii TaxID=179637 RepID=A0AAV3SGY2_HALDO
MDARLDDLQLGPLSVDTDVVAAVEFEHGALRGRGGHENALVGPSLARETDAIARIHTTTTALADFNSSFRRSHR